MLVPTRHKSKISSKLSYPVGAELISAELAAVPLADSFNINFSASQNYFLENRSDAYPILSVLYGGAVEPFEPGGHIRVQPVRRAFKHSVATALKSEFLRRSLIDWRNRPASLPDTARISSVSSSTNAERRCSGSKSTTHPAKRCQTRQPALAPCARRMYNKSDRSISF